MVDLPVNMSYTKVTGHFVRIIADTLGDVNALPEQLPLQGKIFFKPTLNANAPYLKNPTQLLSMVADQVVVTLDANGFIVDVAGNQGIWLVATDDTDLSPVNWVYTISFDLNNGSGVSIPLPSFSASMPGGQTIDMATILPTGSATGDALGIAQSAAAAAATSAANAALSAGGTAEFVRDTMATALVAGAGIAITVNDALDTITISATGAGGTGTDAEVVRDTIAAALIAGAGIAITVNDAGDTITIAATGAGGGLDAEAVQDMIGSFLVAGTGISLTYNDTSNILTIANTGNTTIAGITGLQAALDALTPVDYNGAAWPISRPTGWGSGVGVLRSTRYVNAPLPPSWTLDGDLWFPHPDQTAVTS